MGWSSTLRPVKTHERQPNNSWRAESAVIHANISPSIDQCNKLRYCFIVLSTECSHLASSGKIPKDSIIYNRFECRLCQCKTDKMLCEPKPELCYQRYWLGKKLCFMEKGHALADGERHFDGCNSCLCRNGKSSFKSIKWRIQLQAEETTSPFISSVDFLRI